MSEFIDKIGTKEKHFVDISSLPKEVLNKLRDMGIDMSLDGVYSGTYIQLDREIIHTYTVKDYEKQRVVVLT